MKAALATLLMLTTLAAPAAGQGAAEDGAPEPAREVPDAPHVPDVPELLTVALDAGMGVGTRSYERPYRQIRQVLESAPFVAADVALRVRRCASDCPTARYALDFLLRYQTSIGMHVDEPQLFALPNEVATRASRLELSIAPVLRLGGGARGPSLAVPVGAMLRAFQAEHRDLPVPSYSLFGPHLRVELRWPLGPLTLRVGPEAQWIAVIGNRLKDEGTAGSGVGLGGELALGLDLARHFGLELSYRQAHALASGKPGRADFEDVERFATLQLSGRL